jgi:hypothetical protein
MSRQYGYADRSFLQLSCMSYLAVVIQSCQPPGMTEIDAVKSLFKTGQHIVILATHADQKLSCYSTKEAVAKASTQWAMMYNQELRKTNDCIGLTIQADQIKLVSMINEQGVNGSHCEEHAATLKRIGVLVDATGVREFLGGHLLTAGLWHGTPNELQMQLGGGDVEAAPPLPGSVLLAEVVELRAQVLAELCALRESIKNEPPLHFFSRS